MQGLKPWAVGAFVGEKKEEEREEECGMDDNLGELLT